MPLPPRAPRARRRSRSRIRGVEPDPAEASACPACRSGRRCCWRSLGGLVLNLMPCVLPVLAIKVVRPGRARASAARGEVARHGIALHRRACSRACSRAGAGAWRGCARRAPRSAGASSSRSRCSSAAIAAVLVVFALSLFGVFEFSRRRDRAWPRPARTRPARGAASSRACSRWCWRRRARRRSSAPAIGFAFASPTPHDRRDLPRGRAGPRAALRADLRRAGLGAARAAQRPWMDQLRTALGFAVLGSAVWLLWILGRAAGADAQTAVLAYLCALAAGLVVFGALQKAERTGAARASRWRCVAVLALAGLRVLPLADGGVAGGGARKRRCEPTSSASASARPAPPPRARGAPGVRLLHRRVVPHLQGERARRCSTTRACASSSPPAASRPSRATGPAATTRSAQGAGALRKGRRTRCISCTDAGAADKPIVLPELLTVRAVPERAAPCGADDQGEPDMKRTAFGIAVVAAALLGAVARSRSATRRRTSPPMDENGVEHSLAAYKGHRGRRSSGPTRSARSSSATTSPAPAEEARLGARRRRTSSGWR